MNESVSDRAQRVLILGDTDGDYRSVVTAFAFAGTTGCDRVVSVGDFIGGHRDSSRFLDSVARLVTTHGIDVICVPGNHEPHDLIDAAPIDPEGLSVLRPGVRAVPAGHVWSQHGRAWQGLGGTASPDGPYPDSPFEQTRGPKEVWFSGPDGPEPRTVDMGGWWPQEAITPDDVAAAHAARQALEADGGRVEVFISHDAPLHVGFAAVLGTKGQRVGTRVGDRHGQTPNAWKTGARQRELLDEAVKAARPDWTVCGHWHTHGVVDAPWGGTTIVLSDNTHPHLPHWVIAETPAGSGGVRMLTLDGWTVGDGRPPKADVVRAGPLVRLD